MKQPVVQKYMNKSGKIKNNKDEHLKLSVVSRYTTCINTEVILHIDVFL